MCGTYGILSIGKDALLSQQKAVDVTGHNIANVNTEGYSRQRVDMETKTPVSVDPGQLGSGVRADEIERIYDRFLAGQINYENQEMSRWEAQKNTIEKIEMILDESTGFGLSSAMSEFWNAWQDLSNNAAGWGERVALLAKGEKLAGDLRKVYADIEQQKKALDPSITGSVRQVNLIAENVADLNQKISQAEGTGQNCNDYRDKRDLLLKDLSSIIDFQSFEDGYGRVTVLAGPGKSLVEGVSSWELLVEEDDSGFNQISWTDGKGNSVEITNDINGGKLKGWIEAREVILPGCLDRLDILGEAIIDGVNNIHESGYGLTIDPDTRDPLNSPDGEPYTGISFFTGISASDIEVNSDVVNNVNLIAASGSASGTPGDNSNALVIANLQYLLKIGGITSLDDYYNSIVSDIGIMVQLANTNFDHQVAALSHLNNYRESISGVSIDEEMVNLLKFQNAYDAAAKLITTVDELLQTAMNMV